MNTETAENTVRKKQLRAEYTSRINRVLDYIEKNIDHPLSLETLAKVADFSRFHFHRIFAALVGETLNQFIQRVRVEKAANLLVTKPKDSITDVAFDCGFSNSASFSRSFKEVFGMTPSRWRSEKDILSLQQNSNICKTQGNISKSMGKIWKDVDFDLHYNRGENQNLTWRITMKNTEGLKKLDATIEVKELPKTPVAYIRHIGPYKGDQNLFEGLFGRLFKWAGARDLLSNPDMKVMSVYHDDPEITDEEKLRLSVCISVPQDTEVDGEVGKMTIAGGKYAVGRFEVAGDEYPHAWYTMMAGWMPESGYQPDDRLCFELFQNDPKEHPENKHIFDICVPVKPL